MKKVEIWEPLKKTRCENNIDKWPVNNFMDLIPRGLNEVIASRRCQTSCSKAAVGRESFSIQLLHATTVNHTIWILTIHFTTTAKLDQLFDVHSMSSWAAHSRLFWNPLYDCNSNRQNETSYFTQISLTWFQYRSVTYQDIHESGSCPLLTIRHAWFDQFIYHKLSIDWDHQSWFQGEDIEVKWINQ
jgi:hypothetical protein